MKKNFFLIFALIALFFSYGAKLPLDALEVLSFSADKPLPITFVNKSLCIEDDKVYILIKGINPLTHMDCYIQFNLETGQGSYADVSTAKDSTLYSYKLSQLPLTSNGHVASLPPLTSGRIYFSIAYPMDLIVDAKTQKIQDPDALNSSDSNYYTLYDKVEFTYVVPGAPNIAMNPTAVDFFSLPLYVEMKTNSGVEVSGFSQGRASIFSTVASIFVQNDKTPQKMWSNLIIPFKDPSTEVVISNLRIASTGKAMQATPPIFDPSYLMDSSAYGFNWIRTVWNTYYQSNELKIDATELLPPSNQIFTGKINASNQFVFTAPHHEPLYINLPTTSIPFFAAAGETFNAPNNTPQAIIIRDLTAAFITGILPVNTGLNALDKNYFNREKEHYYMNNSILPIEGQNSGPWYDLYSKALHSFGNNIYTFAYDDVLGIDGTATANIQDSPSAIITLGDLTDTIIPDPYTDSTLYDITVSVASNNPVMYKGELLANNQILKHISVPFTVEIQGNDGQPQTASIYIKYPLVKPIFAGAQGIVIKQTGPTSATVSFPGI